MKKKNVQIVIVDHIKIKMSRMILVCTWLRKEIL